MKFERVQRELYGKPWALMPQVYDSFHRALQNRIQFNKEDAVMEIMGLRVEYKLPQEYTNIDGVAVIEIDGALGYRLDQIDKACIGMIDYNDIREAIDKANSDQTVGSILLHINSPGGMVTGLKETADYIQSSLKPTVAFTDSLCASAGYYLASACTSIFGTYSSDVGCIGTLMSWIDITGAMEKAGLKAELIASGKYKGMGTPGIPLTDEQRAYLQDEVDELAEEFRNYVVSRRGNVQGESMEGQTMSGKNALAAGLIDEVGDFEEALTEAIELGA